MRSRCEDPKYHKYRDYGARGIKVCERWLKFENFFADMGLPPKGMTLERRNNDGDYEPSNCQWATKKDQARNRRNNHLLTYDGREQCLAAWVEELGLPRNTIRNRLNRGWSIDDAFTVPANERNRWTWTRKAC
jgi:hypothetical protein